MSSFVQVTVEPAVIVSGDSNTKSRIGDVTCDGGRVGEGEATADEVAVAAIVAVAVAGGGPVGVAVVASGGCAVGDAPGRDSPVLLTETVEAVVGSAGVASCTSDDVSPLQASITRASDAAIGSPPDFHPNKSTSP